MMSFIKQVNLKIKEILGDGYTSHKTRAYNPKWLKRYQCKIISKFIGHSDVKPMGYIKPTDDDVKER